MNPLKYLAAFYLISILFSCSPSENHSGSVHFFKPTSDSIRYTGRVKKNEDSVTIYWSGTNISMRFRGTSLKAIMRDEHGDNYFNVVIDGDSLFYFRPDSIKRSYTLAEGLPDGEHSVELIKRAEWDRGTSWFYGVEVENGTLTSLPERNQRTIEFFGNSITAGYAIENYTGGDSPDSIFTSNYYTYAAIAARKLKADGIFTVKSGIGIMVSWFPLIMPEMYDRLDPNDSTSKWDFKQITPQVVVINVLQNDVWLMDLPDHPSFKSRFGKQAPKPKRIIEAYRDFVLQIRSVYPDAYIICALGNMDATREGSPWPGYVSEAVAQLNDPKILTHYFPFMNKSGHPRLEDNQVMAESLIKFIENNVKW